LPGEFLDYVKLIEDRVEARVAVVSTGVERKDSLLVDSELDALVDLARIKAGLG
jgi:adenylosuccinate synthase